VLGAISEVDDVELAAVEAAVGSTSFGRGRSYARANRVLKIEWDPDTATLTGSVVGQGALYDTAAFFTSDDGSLEFEDGGVDRVGARKRVREDVDRTLEAWRVGTVAQG